MQEEKSLIATHAPLQKMAVRFIGLKCPVCGKTLLKIRAEKIVPICIRALPPEQSEQAIASVKCPAHGGPVPITVSDETGTVYRANTAE